MKSQFRIYRIRRIEFEICASFSSGGGEVSDYKVNDTFADGYSDDSQAFVADSDISDDFRTETDGLNGHKIMIWENVPGGSLTITISGGDVNLINAMKIDSTPEPGSMILSLFLFIMYLRKK